MKLKMAAAVSLALAAMVMPRALARAQTSPTFAGLVLYNSLTAPVLVAASGTVRKLAFAAGYLPANGINYSMVNRAIVFVTAGAGATTCMVGLSDGAVWSAPVNVPADSTVAITMEDTSSPAAPNSYQAAGFVVTAGSGGNLTILPGSSATQSAISTQQ